MWKRTVVPQSSELSCGRCLRALAAVLALAAAPARAVEPAVDLRFAWPRELAAKVEYEARREQSGKATDGATFTGQLLVTPRGDRIAVAYVGWKGPPGVGGATIESGLRAAEKLVVLVDADGAIAEVEGIPAAIAEMRRAPPFDRDTPEVRKVLELADPMLRTSVEEQWNAHVGLWVGTELAIGEELEGEVETPVPMLPGGSLRMHVRLRALRLVKCPAPRGGRCVELHAVSRADPDDVKKLVVTLMEKFGAPREKAEAAMASLSVVSDVTALLEVGSLVPHRVEIVRTATLAGPEPGKRKDVKVYTYRYASARAKGGRGR